MCIVSVCLFSVSLCVKCLFVQCVFVCQSPSSKLFFCFSASPRPKAKVRVSVSGGLRLDESSGGRACAACLACKAAARAPHNVTRPCVRRIA